MDSLGYYAKDKDNNLHQYEWGAEDEFSILNDAGDYVMRNPKDYEIVHVGIITDVVKVPSKAKVRKWEVIDNQIEINEDFLPNQNLLYTIEFDGVDKFRATLEQVNFDSRQMGVDDAPKTIHYKLNRPIEELTQADKECILDYRGIDSVDGEVYPIDVFIEKSHITFDGVDIEIEAKVTHRVMFGAGESAEDLKNRSIDIYLHGAGDEGHHDKDDLGGDGDIKFV